MDSSTKTFLAHRETEALGKVWTEVQKELHTAQEDLLELKQEAQAASESHYCYLDYIVVRRKVQSLAAALVDAAAQLRSRGIV